MLSVIEETTIIIEKLKLLVESEMVLRRAGYVMHPLAPEVIESKKRCERCGSRISRKGRPYCTDSARPSNVSDKQTTLSVELFERRPDVGPDSPGVMKRPEKAVASVQINDVNGSTRPACQAHPGRVIKKHFSCCQKHVSSTGCTAYEGHIARSYRGGDLEREWTFRPTPEHVNTREKCLSPSVSYSEAQHEVLEMRCKLNAVTLDCEMGVAKSGESQLIRLTLVDFFTGEALIDSLVKPAAPMSHYNTKYSGVTAADMRKAERSGSCIRGHHTARERIWKYVGPETIVIMHGGRNDLSALRWIHPTVIDSLLLERFVNPVEGGKSLKNLSFWRLGRVIQKGKGHCSLEDALACRELVHWHICQIPDL